MTMWIVVAATGGVLGLWGLAALIQRYHAGRITLRYLLAAVLGCLSFLSFALLDALRPDLGSGPATLVLLPGLIALVVVIREHQRRGRVDHPDR